MDYVKFSGLYREVYLVQTERLYIPFPWESRTAGVTITTPTVKSDAATIDVKTSIRNTDSEKRICKLLTRVIDADDVVVLRMKSKAEIPAGSEIIISQVNGLDKEIHLWSCDDPYLYKVNSLVFDGDDEISVDCIDNPLGIRKFELHHDLGFSINGKPVKLIGINRHQHYAYICMYIVIAMK
jgi:beta-galactosidase